MKKSFLSIIGLMTAIGLFGAHLAHAQDPCSDPGTKPFWDNSITNNGDGTGLLLNVLATAGFDRIALEDSLTQNLTLLQPEDATNNPIAQFVPTGTNVAPADVNLGTGNLEWSFTDTTNRPTSIRVPIAAEFVGSSTGVFNFVDICGRIGRYDILDGVLPVELTAFSVVLDGSDAVLNWQTASELNNQGFEIQEASGDQAFEALGFVEGAGTTVFAQSYRYVAHNLTPGTHRFRLKQVDFSGAIFYSTVVEVSANLTDDYVLSPAYPNPFSVRTNFTLSIRKAQHVRVDVYDMLGRRVAALFDGTIPASSVQAFSLDGTTLSGGTYLYRVTGETFSESRTVTMVK